MQACTGVARYGLCAHFQALQCTCAVYSDPLLQLVSALQHCDVEVFLNLADVVLTGQTTVLVAVNHQPAIALGVAGGAIKGKGLLGQPLDQCRAGWVLSS